MKICVATVLSTALLLGNSVNLRAAVPGPKGLVGPTGQTGVKDKRSDPDNSNQRVAFTVVLTSPSEESFRYSTRLPFQETLTLLPGTSFDLETGAFTCGVPGTYVFMFSANKYASSHRLWVYLWKNDDVVVSGGSSDSSDHAEQVSASAVLVLHGGDTVYLTMIGTAFSTNEGYTSFSGFLLYPE